VLLSAKTNGGAVMLLKSPLIVAIDCRMIRVAYFDECIPSVGTYGKKLFEIALLCFVTSHILAKITIHQ